MIEQNENFIHGSVWRTTAPSDGTSTPYVMVELNGLDKTQARVVWLSNDGPEFFKRDQPSSWWTTSALQEYLLGPRWSLVHEEFTRAKLLAVDRELHELGKAYDAKVLYYQGQVKGIQDEGIKLLSMNLQAGQPLTMAMKHPVFVVVASHMARFFKEEGGLNYAAVELTDPTSNRRFEVVVKPVSTKMPATLAAERLAELTTANAKILELETQINNLRVGSKETAT